MAATALMQIGTAPLVKPAVRAKRASPAPRRAAIAVRASSEQKTQQDLSEQISSSIKEAEDVCESGSAQECASAWDEVEELSAEAAHQKDNQKWVQKGQSNDPLEEYCEENPESDECRVYED